MIQLDKVALDKIARQIDSFVQIPVETDFLLHYAQRANHGVIEIGSWKGRSTVYLATVAKSKGIPMVAVDTWKDCDMPGCAGVDFYEEFVDHMRSADLTVCRIEVDFTLNQHGAIYTIRYPSAVAARIAKPLFETSGKRFDLLFIDADHSYQAVRSDFYNWTPLLTRPAVVILHDIACGHPGPRQLFVELMERFDYKAVGNIAAVFVE